MGKCLRVVVLIGIAACGTRGGQEKSGNEDRGGQPSETVPGREGGGEQGKQSGREQAGGQQTASAPGDQKVMLCDGQSSVTVPAGAEKTPENGRAVADALMAQWRQQHPGGGWQAEVARAHPRIPPPADNRSVLAAGQREGH